MKYIINAVLDRSFRTNLQRKHVVLCAENVLSEVEVRQLPHRGKQSDVTALHSEHRTVTNAATQAARTDHGPRVWVRRCSALPIIPDHCSLSFQNTLALECHKRATYFWSNTQ